MVTVIVTGAAGFIGSHTSERLLAEGFRVVGVDNFRTGRRENLSAALRQPAFVLREVDVSEAGVMDALAAEFSAAAIVHLAALVGVPESIADPALNFRLNLLATHLVAEAARQHKVGRVVFASSAAVYGDSPDQPLAESTTRCHPISPYGAAKLASEDLLLGYGATYGMSVHCLRYFNVFGPRQDPASPYSGVVSVLAKRFRERLPVVIFGDGRQSRDFISVHDVARANAIAVSKSGSTSCITNICTGRATSLRRLLEIFGEGCAGCQSPVYAPRRPGEIRHSVGDPAAAKRELGFEARWKLEAGIRELVSA
jgi:UDP-glucose 4-epimerase